MKRLWPISKYYLGVYIVDLRKIYTYIHINYNAVSDVKVLRNKNSPSSANTMTNCFRE
jgi:hypothetical protein